MNLDYVYSKLTRKLKKEKAGMQDDVVYKKRIENETYIIHLSYFREVGTYLALYVSTGEDTISRAKIHEYYNDTSKAMKALLKHIDQVDNQIRGYIVSSVGALTEAGRGVDIDRHTIVVGCTLTSTIDMEINEIESFLVANSWKKV